MRPHLIILTRYLWFPRKIREQLKNIVHLTLRVLEISLSRLPSGEGLALISFHPFYKI